MDWHGVANAALVGSSPTLASKIQMKIPKRKHYRTKEYTTKNNRRCELIDKMVDAKWGARPDGLTKAEQSELKMLEKETSEYIKAVFGPIYG